MYHEMSEMFASKKEFEEAYKFAVLYKQFDDSSKREAFNQGLIDARIRFQVETKESELQILSLQLENQRLIMYGILGFLGLTIIILLLLYRQFKINEKRRTAELNRKLSEITQANLRQQMNPHFIFNTLNSIQYYMYQNDKISTNNYLTKFSSLIRRILENSQHSAIPLREELEAVELYLELEMIRFKNKFDFEIKVDDDIDTLMYKVPAMIIQPYVENAVCHGLMQKNGTGHLFIEIEHKTNHLSCRIVDNGIGREAAKEIARERNKNHISLGTKITESRIEINNKLYGTNLKTLYTDLKNDLGEATGTMVEIQIPILT